VIHSARKTVAREEVLMKWIAEWIVYDALYAYCQEMSPSRSVPCSLSSRSRTARHHPATSGFSSSQAARASKVGEAHHKGCHPIFEKKGKERASRRFDTPQVGVFVVIPPQDFC
jgi:hypothetical protein